MNRIHCIFALVCIVALNNEIGVKASAIDNGLTISSRIVGGNDADDGEVPYQCYLQKNSRHYCGCAIVSSKWIITAAHCILGERPRDIVVVVGTNKLSSGGTSYMANKTIVHKLFVRSVYTYDIGLIRLQTPIEFNEKVQPIEYSAKVIEPGTTGLKLTGWGLLSADAEENSDNLQKLYVKAISNEECAKEYAGVHVTHLCTLAPKGHGICSGDSGGPLVLGNELVGITSFSDPCANGLPDGFARISYLYDWIEEKIKLS